MLTFLWWSVLSLDCMCCILVKSIVLIQHGAVFCQDVCYIVFLLKFIMISSWYCFITSLYVVLSFLQYSYCWLSHDTVSLLACMLYHLIKVQNTDSLWHDFIIRLCVVFLLKFIMLIFLWCLFTISLYVVLSLCPNQ